VLSAIESILNTNRKLAVIIVYCFWLRWQFYVLKMFCHSSNKVENVVKRDFLARVLNSNELLAAIFRFCICQRYQSCYFGADSIRSTEAEWVEMSASLNRVINRNGRHALSIMWNFLKKWIVGLQGSNQVYCIKG
jgi:hypothetical protein